MLSGCGTAQQEAHYNQRHSEQDAFGGHQPKVVKVDEPPLAGSQLQSCKYDNHGEGRRYPGEFAAEAEISEEVLKPYKSNDANLRLVQHIGIYKDSPQLVENNKGQQENYCINRPAGPLKIRVLSEAKKLTTTVSAVTCHWCVFLPSAKKYLTRLS